MLTGACNRKKQDESEKEEEAVAQEEEEMEVSFDEVEKLETLGVNASDVAKLKAAGIYTIAGVRMQTKKVRKLNLLSNYLLMYF